MASRFILPTRSETFCATSIRRPISSFVVRISSRKASYRSRTESISRSACFSSISTGMNGITNPMTWSTESIRSIGLVNCSAPLNRALILVDRVPDLGEGQGLRVLLEVLHVPGRFPGREEAPFLSGERDRPDPLHGLRTDQVPVLGGLHVRDLEQGAGGVERFAGQVGLRAALDGQADRLHGAVLPHGRQQVAAGGLVDLELRPALGVDDELVERYDGSSLRIFGCC